MRYLALAILALCACAIIALAAPIGSDKMPDGTYDVAVDPKPPSYPPHLWDPSVGTGAEITADGDSMDIDNWHHTIEAEWIAAQNAYYPTVSSGRFFSFKLPDKLFEWEVVPAEPTPVVVLRASYTVTPKT